MYDYLKGIPVGVVNDFDLATWVNHSTTNNDRTGTIPFMAIDLLNGGLDRGIRREYRHDLESFSWILAFVSVAQIEYEGSKIKISPVQRVNTWFKDKDDEDRDLHVHSKQNFYMDYGYKPSITDNYGDYYQIIKRITRYWSRFHSSRRPELRMRKPGKVPEPLGEPVVEGREGDDPAQSLRLFIEYLKQLDEEVKADLVEALGA